MKTITCLLLLLAATFLQAQQPASVLIGMVLLEDPKGFSPNATVANLQTAWAINPTYEPGTATSSVALVIDGYTVVLSPIPLPVPEKEIRETAEYNYLWSNGADEALRHRGHVIVSLLGAGKNPVEENLLFSKVVAAVLSSSPSAIGVYMGGRTLLMKKSFYLNNMKSVSKENLPLFNWIYFGMRQEDKKYSMYTYGLADFGKLEVEILRSSQDFQELQQMLYGIVHYVLSYDATLNHGETIGMSATQKLKITVSEGVFLEGTTAKISY
ncbi:MAG: DUF4261 domain-containing protein [Saprospiraceae bacterium]|nr:DUF4261 domain-containing protein [Saprospiraceae bacterium]